MKWDTFVSPEKKSLPPLNGGQSRRSFFRNGNVLSIKMIAFLVLWVFLHSLLKDFILAAIGDRALGRGLEDSVSLCFGICFPPSVTEAMEERKW